MAAETALGAKMAAMQTGLQTIHRGPGMIGADIVAVAGSGRGPDSLALDGRPGVGTAALARRRLLGRPFPDSVRFRPCTWPGEEVNCHA